MSRKFTRLLFVASMVAGASVAPMLGAYAQDERGVDITGTTFGVDGKVDAWPGDVVKWTVRDDGQHTVKPVEPAKWIGEGNQEGSGTLKGGDTFSFRFDRPGTYAYFCEIHGADKMKGEVNVLDPNPTTTTTAPPSSTPPPPPPPPPPPSSTTTTRPVVTTTAPPTTAAGSKSQPTGKAPTTTAPKEKDKDKKPKDEETTTTTAPPPPPIDLPNEAIIPSLPGFGPGPSTQNGVEIPDGTPEGDAVALLKSGKRGGGNAKKLLIVSGLGLGLLGFGTAGYKYANRSSKYFPA